MALILGKKIVGRLETLQYANKKFNWRSDIIIGISCFFGFWAWLLARLTGKKCIYYAIDFYSPEIGYTWWDKLFIWSAMKMDMFLVRHADELWDISSRILTGRVKFAHYSPPEARFHTIVPLSFPPHYLRSNSPISLNRGIFVGLCPYGLELFKNIPEIKVFWLGKHRLMFIKELLDEISIGGFGIALWKDRGNHYYGDPGKTKLYSACGIPVITTNNTGYAHIIEKTHAGIVIDYNEKSVKEAVKELLKNYNFYKGNVSKTWEYINADNIFGNLRLLE